MRRCISALPAAAVLGLALLTSTVRAQEPKALPMDKPVAPLEAPAAQPLPAAAVPAMIAPGTPCAPCDTACAPGCETGRKRLIGNLVGKCANPCNPVPLGCGSGCSERAFIFGSCRKFFDCHAGCGPIPPQAVPVGNCYYGTFHRF